MEKKHTPGPWQIEGKYRGDDGSLYLSTMHPMPVFELVPVVGKEDEHIANARLIAAAPELLAALKDAMRSSRKDFKGGPDGDRQHREAYAEQFAAIAKAEGWS